MPTDWEKIINIDRSWVNKHLNIHFTDTYNKLTVRGYTLKASGTSITAHSIAEELSLMIPEYVYGKEKIEQLGAGKAMLSAIKFFGNKHPNTDGKYGELLLFALVEGVLGCKMVAHKLRSLSNFKDQVKGGDGIFLGDYLLGNGNKNIAYLIGESKLMGQYSTALKDAYESINRFHSQEVSAEFSFTEFIVAKENLIFSSEIDIDELYDRLTPSSPMFKNQILVHPVLIMYNSDKISTCEMKSATPTELEDSIKGMVDKEKVQYYNQINNLLQLYPEIQKVYLDFFIIPFNDIKNFRNSLYFNIHGISYPT